MKLFLLIFVLQASSTRIH